MRFKTLVLTGLVILNDDMSSEIETSLNEAFKYEEEGNFGPAADCFLAAAKLVDGIDDIPARILKDDSLLCRWVVGCLAPSDFGFACAHNVKFYQDSLTMGFKLSSFLPDLNGEIDFWKQYFEDQSLGDPIQKRRLRGHGLELYKAIYKGDLEGGRRILANWGTRSAIRTRQLYGHLAT